MAHFAQAKEMAFGHSTIRMVSLKKKENMKINLIDRFVLNSKKLESIKKSVKDIIKLEDPIDKILENWKK